MNAFSSAPFPRPPRLSPALAILLASAFIVGVGFLDYHMPIGMSFSFFYMLGIGFVAWRGGLYPSIVLSICAAVLMDFKDWYITYPAGFPHWVVLWNAITRAVLFSSAAWCLATLTRLNQELRSKVTEKVGQYRAIMATAMDGFAAVNGEGRITDVNEAYCRTLGYRKEELIGAHINQIELRENSEQVGTHIDRVRACGSDRFETLQRHKDGSAVDIEVSVTSLSGANGVMVCFLRDIRERKQAEARLRESQERYRSLAESSPDEILVLDADSKVLYANSAAAAAWNCTPEQMIGLSQQQLFASEIAEFHQDLVRKVFESGQPLCHDEFLPFPSGEKWKETRLVPVFGPNHKVQSVIVIAVDIAERKRTEWLLEAQRDLGLKLSRTSNLDPALNALLKFAVQIKGVDCAGVYLCDPVTGELKLAAHEGPVSEAFLRKVRIHAPDSFRAELVRKGKPVYDLYKQIADLPDPTDDQLRSAAILPFSHEGKVIGSLHLGSHTDTGIPAQSRIVIETVVAQAAAAIARIRSETERQRLERQLLDISDREQARIGQELHDGLCQQLVSLAFDANSLYTGLAQAGRSEGGLASRIAQYLDDAITEARHLSRGLFPIRLQAEGLPSALKELARGVSARFGVYCTCICEEPADVAAPASIHLYRIAQEAVSNAIKHGRAKTVTIRLGYLEDCLKLTVEDDGVGFTAAAATVSGMGLHIMDYRARTIGGTLQCSPGPDRGMIISCCVPAAKFEKIPA